MTESDLQNALFCVLADRQYSHITPNVHLWDWESDLVAITDSGYLVEYEIKLSKGDFQRDMTKKRHRYFLSHYRTSLGDRTGKVPARFLYATPPGLVTPSDLPEYAGLTYVRPDALNKQERAPRLTPSKARDRHRTRLMRSLQRRAWEPRLAR